MRVAPSKMNLIRFKRTLAFLRRAHDLLEEKREILLLELNRRIGEATKLRSQLNEQLRSAYALLDAASVIIGAREMSLISKTPRYDYDITVSKKKIMGVSVLSLELLKESNPLTYGISKPTILLDQFIEKFDEILPMTLRLAELESVLIRLVEEVKKTQHRINALEQFLIPRYQNMVSMISAILEERDREEFVRVKKVKTLLEKKTKQVVAYG
ncbi:MAG: V-type ATP synthase subunit D [Candidatus Methanomethyliaceae archaeon]|nr:V-type ATP synthase subunit D [Candidatus Methanomethyliaceae archaeon]